MCYHKIHNCKYCNTLYPCSFPDVACPTLNDDMDRNMCESCRTRLEQELLNIESDELNSLSIQDILLGETDEN